MSLAAAVLATKPGRARRPAAVGLLSVLLALVAMASVALVPLRAAAQVPDRTVRLTITEVGDSTFAFDAANLRWIKSGERGMAVDPKRRDALVARFAVLQVENGKATAVITGETTELTMEHVVVMEVPVRPWYQHTLFWGGAIAGMLLGVFAGSL